MFQDGSVKAVLAESSSVPSISRITILIKKTHSAFLGSSTSKELVPEFLHHKFKPKTPLNFRLASFYRFLFNGFKSFNSLFKVLFIFPSQYLFAIGFPPIFSLGRSLSPALSSNPKELDSMKVVVDSVLSPSTGISPSLSEYSSLSYAIRPSLTDLSRLQFFLFLKRFSIWTFACSVALTKAIFVNFFSST